MFTHGGVAYPLTATATNSLLRDADPALFYALDFIAAVLDSYIGPRLASQAAREGLVIDSAVRQRLHVEPSPFLFADQFKFPSLAIYRKSELYSAGLTMSSDRDVSEWEYVYVLPPLMPRQVQELQPILRSAAVTIRHCVGAGHDPAWSSNADVWTLAGVEKAMVTAVRYGGYEALQENQNYYRAIVGTIQVTEIENTGTSSEDAEPFEGFNVQLDHGQPDTTVLDDVTSFKTYQPPTVTAVSPTSGTKAGGTTVTVTGTLFRTGTPTRITIGGSECTDVVVLSATQVQGVTAAHVAYPTFIADVVVTNADGQSGRKPAAYSFTTP